MFVLLLLLLFGKLKKSIKKRELYAVVSVLDKLVYRFKKSQYNTVISKCKFNKKKDHQRNNKSKNKNYYLQKSIDS